MEVECGTCCVSHLHFRGILEAIKAFEKRCEIHLIHRWNLLRRHTTTSPSSPRVPTAICSYLNLEAEYCRTQHSIQNPASEGTCFTSCHSKFALQHTQLLNEFRQQMANYVIMCLVYPKTPFVPCNWRLYGSEGNIPRHAKQRISYVFQSLYSGGQLFF